MCREHFEKLMNAWDLVICYVSSSSYYDHELIDWARRHTLNTVLQPDWQTRPDASKELLLHHLRTLRKLVHSGQMGQDVAQLLQLTEDPWGDPVVHRIMHGQQRDADEEALFRAEYRVVLPARVLALYEMGKRTEAQRFAEVFVKCAYDSRYCLNGDGLEEEKEHLTDLCLTFWYRKHRLNDMVLFFTRLKLQDGVHLIQRQLRKDVKVRQWRNSVHIATVAVRFFLTSAMLAPLNDARSHIRSLVAHWASLSEHDPNRYEDTTSMVGKVISQAKMAEHIYLLSQAIAEQFGCALKPVCIELYVRGLTSNLNELEHQKLKNNFEKTQEVELQMSNALLELSDLLKIDVYAWRECILTAFSLNPTQEILRNVEYAAVASGKVRCSNLNRHVGSISCAWGISPEMSDGGVADVLADPRLALNARVLGVSTDLCDDLAVVLRCSRYNALNWSINWTQLKNKCILYMRNIKRERSLPKKLIFLKPNYDDFRNLSYSEIRKYYGLTETSTYRDVEGDEYPARETVCECYRRRCDQCCHYERIRSSETPMTDFDDGCHESLTATCGSHPRESTTWFCCTPPSKHIVGYERRSIESTKKTDAPSTCCCSNRRAQTEDKKTVYTSQHDSQDMDERRSPDAAFSFGGTTQICSSTPKKFNFQIVDLTETGRTDGPVSPSLECSATEVETICLSDCNDEIENHINETVEMTASKNYQMTGSHASEKKAEPNKKQRRRRRKRTAFTHCKRRSKKSIKQEIQDGRDMYLDDRNLNTSNEHARGSKTNLQKRKSSESCPSSMIKKAEQNVSDKPTITEPTGAKKCARKPRTQTTKTENLWIREPGKRLTRRSKEDDVPRKNEADTKTFSENQSSEKEIPKTSMTSKNANEKNTVNEFKVQKQEVRQRVDTVTDKSYEKCNKKTPIERQASKRPINVENNVNHQENVTSGYHPNKRPRNDETHKRNYFRKSQEGHNRKITNIHEGNYQNRMSFSGEYSEHRDKVKRKPPTTKEIHLRDDVGKHASTMSHNTSKKHRRKQVMEKYDRNMYESCADFGNFCEICSTFKLDCICDNLQTPSASQYAHNNMIENFNHVDFVKNNNESRNLNSFSNEEILEQFESNSCLNPRFQNSDRSNFFSHETGGDLYVEIQRPKDNFYGNKANNEVLNERNISSNCNFKLYSELNTTQSESQGRHKDTFYFGSTNGRRRGKSGKRKARKSKREVDSSEVVEMNRNELAEHSGHMGINAVKLTEPNTAKRHKNVDSFLPTENRSSSPEVTVLLQKSRFSARSKRVPIRYSHTGERRNNLDEAKEKKSQRGRKKTTKNKQKQRQYHSYPPANCTPAVFNEEIDYCVPLPQSATTDIQFTGSHESFYRQDQAFDFEPTASSDMVNGYWEDPFTIQPVHPQDQDLLMQVPFDSGMASEFLPPTDNVLTPLSPQRWERECSNHTEELNYWQEERSSSFFENTYDHFPLSCLFNDPGDSMLWDENSYASQNQNIPHPPFQTPCSVAGDMQFSDSQVGSGSSYHQDYASAGVYTETTAYSYQSAHSSHGAYEFSAEHVCLQQLTPVSAVPGGRLGFVDNM